MALPEFWLAKNRRDLAERALVNKREQQAQLSRKCESAAKYHRELNLLSSQYRNLEENVSSKTPRVNMESRTEEDLRAKRRERMYERQNSLRLLLSRENSKYMAELKALSSDKPKEADPWNISKLKEDIDELQKKRMEDEEMLKKTSRHHFHNEPKLSYLSEREEQQIQQDILNDWTEQKNHLTKQRERQITHDMERKGMLMHERKQTESEIEAVKAERVEVSKQWETVIADQFLQLEERKAQADNMMYEVSMLDEYNKAVKDAAEKYNKVKDIQQERINRILMFRFAKEKVRKMSTEVKLRLDLDLESLTILEDLLAKKENSVNLNLQIIASAKESIKEMMSKENTRDSDIQMFFEEEVSKMWNEKKKVWDSEMKLQDKLIFDVFESLKTQTEDRKKASLLEQKHLIEDQNELLIRLMADKERAKDEAQHLWEKEAHLTEKLHDLNEKVKKFENSLPVLLKEKN